MKKLNLTFKNVKEVLTREQLKQVVGGMGTGDVCEGVTGEVCCYVGTIEGTRGECRQLLNSGCSFVVSVEDPRCPEEPE